MKKPLLKFLTALPVLLFFTSVQAQPVYRFTVKVGIDSQSVDSLGGLDHVKRNLKQMFHEINKAFNYDRRFQAYYNFDVDWDALYVYEGSSRDEVGKPHPDHDYLVVMDGVRSHPDEGGGGWNGSYIQTIYHDRGTESQRFNNPFDRMATDGIIHEFGHSRGMPDIYAMTVDADKNPINGLGNPGIRCMMNYCYGETHWSDYAVNMINLSADKRVEIDSLVNSMCPELIRIAVKDSSYGKVKGADIRLYPVGWYSYTVNETPEIVSTTNSKGVCTLDGRKVFPKSRSCGLKYPNYLVEAEYGNRKAYGWLPLYEVQNAKFEGKKAYELVLILKDEKPSTPKDFDVTKNFKRLKN